MAGWPQRQQTFCQRQASPAGWRPWQHVQRGRTWRHRSVRRTGPIRSIAASARCSFRTACRRRRRPRQRERGGRLSTADAQILATLARALTSPAAAAGCGAMAAGCGELRASRWPRGPRTRGAASSIDAASQGWSSTSPSAAATPASGRSAPPTAQPLAPHARTYRRSPALLPLPLLVRLRAAPAAVAACPPAARPSPSLSFRLRAGKGLRVDSAPGFASLVLPNAQSVGSGQHLLAASRQWASAPECDAKSLSREIGSLLMMVSAPKNLEVKAKRLAAASHWLATRPRLPPSSTSPSPLSRQGRAQKSRLRRVSQSRMLAIPYATQWRHGARNRTTPIGKNFGGSRRLCTSVSCRQAFKTLSAWICKD